MAILEKLENTETPLNNAIGKFQERTAKAVENAETKAALLGSRAQVKWLKASQLTRERIHQNPIAAVLAGVGAGALLGSAATFLSLRKNRSNSNKTNAREK